MKEDIIKISEEKGIDNNHTRLLKSISWYLYLCLIQQILRDEKGIHVEVTLMTKGYSYDVSVKMYVEREGFDFKTYEEALEKGVLEGLKLI